MLFIRGSCSLTEASFEETKMKTSKGIYKPKDRVYWFNETEFSLTVVSLLGDQLGVMFISGMLKEYVTTLHIPTTKKLKLISRLML